MLLTRHGGATAIVGIGDGLEAVLLTGALESYLWQIKCKNKIYIVGLEALGDTAALFLGVGFTDINFRHQHKDGPQQKVDQWAGNYLSPGVLVYENI